MKKYTFIVVALLSAALFVTSCHKDEDEGLLPQISFKTASGYTAADDTVATGTTLLTGIHAAKSESEDVLKSFSITRKYDSTADTTVYTEALSGTSGDSYDHDYSITTRSVPGKEIYTYSIVNRDGLVNSIHLTLVVQ